MKHVYIIVGWNGDGKTVISVQESMDKAIVVKEYIDSDERFAEYDIGIDIEEWEVGEIRAE